MADLHRMKVLLIIPAFNASEWIARTIESLKAQTHANIQIIVVDDASTDNTAELAAMSDVKLLIHHTNRGTYAAINTAIDYAIDSQIKFDAWYVQGADDYAFPTLVADMLDPMCRNPTVMASFAHYFRMDYATASTGEQISGKRSSVVMYRRQVLNALHRYDQSTRFGADTEFYDRVVLTYGQQAIVEVPKPVANCMTHEKNLTRLFGYHQRAEYVKQYRLKHQEGR